MSVPAPSRSEPMRLPALVSIVLPEKVDVPPAMTSPTIVPALVSCSASPVLIAVAPALVMRPAAALLTLIPLAVAIAAPVPRFSIVPLLVSVRKPETFASVAAVLVESIVPVLPMSPKKPVSPFQSIALRLPPLIAPALVSVPTRPMIAPIDPPARLVIDSKPELASVDNNATPPVPTMLPLLSMLAVVARKVGTPAACPTTRPLVPVTRPPATTVRASVWLTKLLGIGCAIRLMPASVPPSTSPATVSATGVPKPSPDPIRTATAGAPAPRTVAPCSTVTRVPKVVTRNPSASVPRQMVVPFATVGSGAHCAKAGPASIAASVIALVSSARARTRADRAPFRPIMTNPPRVTRIRYDRDEPLSRRKPPCRPPGATAFHRASSACHLAVEWDALHVSGRRGGSALRSARRQTGCMPAARHPTGRSSLMS